MSGGMINLKDNVAPYSEIGLHTTLWPDEGMKQITEDCLSTGNFVEIIATLKEVVLLRTN